ncbi:NAD(P)-binding domain-containing protein, partial [Gammaproteobacteria bacterium]|nr:NAD(P)-binding domain-containing protein [Gammaproteobacteria bacterium]
SSLGIIGLGRLGRMVAGYAIALGMEVSFYDPFIDLKKIEPKWKDNIIRHRELRDLVRHVDIVSVHVPHSLPTENLIDRNVFQEFKIGSYFINTARGELVDHEALLEALESKRLAGAALDVFENEFNPEFSIKTHELWSYFRANQNVILTPHIGGSTEDAWRLTEELTIDRVLERLRVRDDEIKR